MISIFRSEWGRGTPVPGAPSNYVLAYSSLAVIKMANFRHLLVEKNGKFWAYFGRKIFWARQEVTIRKNFSFFQRRRAIAPFALLNAGLEPWLLLIVP